MATTKDAPLAVSAGFQDMIVAERPKGVDEGVLGSEGIGRDDFTLPRLGLAQKMSPEIDPTSPKVIPGLAFTDLFNSLSKKVYGKGPVHFVILKRYDPRWIEFNPINEGGGIKDRDVRAGDPRTEFGPDGEKPLATMFYDFLVLNLSDLDAADPIQSVIALSLKSSGIKAAKHLNFLVKQRGPKQICKGVYELTTGSETDKKTGGVYAVYKFKNAGWLKPASPLEALAVEMFEAWKDRAVDIDVDTTQDDTGFDPEKLERQAATADM